MPRVSVPRNSGAAIVAGLSAYHGSVAAAARAVGVSRGSFDGIIGGRHGMSEGTRQKVELYLNDRRGITDTDAKLVKDLGRAIEYAAAGRAKATTEGQHTFRTEAQRLKTYDRTNQRKEVSYFVQRQNELSGRTRSRRGRAGQQSMGGGFGGGGGGGGVGPGDESSDEEWYAEYGAWVEEVESWRASQEGDLPELEELPF